MTKTTLLLLSLLVLPHPGATFAEDTPADAAIRQALQRLESHFNRRDRRPLVGEVDYEYTYVPRHQLPAGHVSAARLAGLATGPVPAQAPDLLGADIAALQGRNKLRRLPTDQPTELALRPSHPRPGPRLTTAEADYTLAERRLLRWDLDYLMEEIPPGVRLDLQPGHITVDGNQAQVEVTYGFRAPIERPENAAYRAQSGAITLPLRQLDGAWKVADLRALVDHLRAVVTKID